MFKETNWSNNTDVNSKYLLHVKSYKYLGSIVNGDKSSEEEMKKRISLVNEGYYANDKIFKSISIFKKKAKLKL
jgi:hypothetical protein